MLIMCQDESSKSKLTFKTFRFSFLTTGLFCSKNTSPIGTSTAESNHLQLQFKPTSRQLSNAKSIRLMPQTILCKINDWLGYKSNLSTRSSAGASRNDHLKQDQQNFQNNCVRVIVLDAKLIFRGQLDFENFNSN